MARQATKNGYVYLIKCRGVYKIGVAKDPERRLAALQTGSSEKMHIVHTIFSDKPFELEKYFHKLFAHKRLAGEWFALTSGQADLVTRYAD